MDIIYLCSYKLSPGGFQCGKVSCGNGCDKKYVELEGYKLPSATYKVLLHTPDARGSHGKIPGSEMYEILKKGIKGNKGCDKYDPITLNFSILCSSKDEYLRAKTYVQKCNGSSEIFQRFADPIVIYPDDIIYGIRIDYEKLNKIHEGIMRSEPHEIVDEEYFVENRDGDTAYLEDKEVSPDKGPFREEWGKVETTVGRDDKKGKKNSKDNNNRNAGDRKRNKGRDNRKALIMIFFLVIICGCIAVTMFKIMPDLSEVAPVVDAATDVTASDEEDGDISHYGDGGNESRPKPDIDDHSLLETMINRLEVIVHSATAKMIDTSRTFNSDKMLSDIRKSISILRCPMMTVLRYRRH